MRIDFIANRNEYGWMSNSYPSPFEAEIEGKGLVLFWCVEQYYCYFKSTSEEYRDSILNAFTFKAIKYLGSSKGMKVQGYSLVEDWDEIKFKVMKQALKMKFDQNPILRRRLLETGNATLVEGSFWDSYWGTGRDGNGKNKMGKLLMKLRKKLKNGD